MVSKDRENSRNAVFASKLGLFTMAIREELVCSAPKFCLRIAESSKKTEFDTFKL